MDVSFHCSVEKNFKSKNHPIRAFLYTNYSVEPHNHDFYELNIVLQGEGIHQIENARFNAKSGDVFIIPPMTVHAYYNTNKLDVYHILLQKNFVLGNRKEFSGIPGFLQLIEIEPFLRQHFPGEMFLHLSRSQIINLKNDLNLIEDNNTFDTDELIPLKIHTVWKILYWFSGLLFKQIKDTSMHLSKYDAEIIKVLEYIHQNYDKKITINSLCEKSFLSRSTFLRSFQNICECTPIEYLNKYRCEQAIEMMKHSHLSKTEIAYSCGFYDLSHMTKILKKLT